MTNILDTIIANKKLEVAKRKAALPIDKLEKKQRNREYYSISESLTRENSSGIIAEFKRKSPSKNWINQHAASTDIVPDYQKAGAAASSILTDQFFFGGSDNDLVSAGELVTLPILRKDFMVDEYQIVEADKMGADVILLIAACLSPQQVKNLAKKAREHKLEVLLEVHDELELDCICEEVNLVGVNNRNLKTFKTSIDNSIKLSSKIPDSFVKVSESGLSGIKEINELKSYGYQGFLIGETFMKTNHPGVACADFIKTL